MTNQLKQKEDGTTGETNRCPGTVSIVYAVHSTRSCKKTLSMQIQDSIVPVLISIAEQEYNAIWDKIIPDEWSRIKNICLFILNMFLVYKLQKSVSKR